MQIVINIPERMYLNAKADKLCGANILVNAIKNSITLPKGHGRLIDADALLKDVRDNSESYFADDFAHEWVDAAPTVLEAESEEP